MPAALQTLRMATRCTPERRTTFSAASRIAAMVASERRLRLRRRAGIAVGVDAVARWRDSFAAVDALVGSAGALDLARFLVDTGAFIGSLLPCALRGPCFLLKSCRTLLSMSSGVTFTPHGYRKHIRVSCSV